jgi:hypothetical protein
LSDRQIQQQNIQCHANYKQLNWHYKFRFRL